MTAHQSADRKGRVFGIQAHQTRRRTCGNPGMKSEITTRMRRIVGSMSERDYRAFDAANWSRIKHAGRSAAMARHKANNPGKHSVVGKVVHGVCLDHERFHQQFAVCPPDVKLSVDGRMTTKAAKDWAAEQRAAGLEVVSPRDAEAAAVCIEGFFRCRVATALRKMAQTEVRFAWHELIDGEPALCKGAADLLVNASGRVILGDLKTSSAVNPREFLREAQQHNYLGQLAMYGDGLVASGVVERVDEVLWVVCHADTGETFVVRPGQVTTDYDEERDQVITDVDQTAVLDAGRAYWRRCLETWVRAERSGQWGGCMADDEIHNIGVSEWHLEQLHGG